MFPDMFIFKKQIPFLQSLLTEVFYYMQTKLSCRRLYQIIYPPAFYENACFPTRLTTTNLLNFFQSTGQKLHLILSLIFRGSCSCSAFCIHISLLFVM